MDEKTFSILFVRYRWDFTRFANWLTRDTDDADDLVQEAYCFAWRRVERIPVEARRFIRWIFTGMHFLWKNRIRSRETELRYHRRVYKLLDAAQNETRPDTDENMRPYRFLVFDAVRRLPKKYRAPIFLHEMMDVGCDEVAGIEGTCLGTVKSRLYRGRKLLQRSLVQLAREENFKAVKNTPKPESEPAKCALTLLPMTNEESVSALPAEKKTAREGRIRRKETQSRVPSE